MPSEPSVPPELPMRSLAPTLLAGVAVLALLGGLAWWLIRSDAAPKRAAVQAAGGEVSPKVEAAPAPVVAPEPLPPPPPEASTAPPAAPRPPLPALGSAASGLAPPSAAPDPDCANPCTGKETDELLSALGATAVRARGCYERALSSNPGLAGRLEVGVRVGRSGSACSASVGSDALGDAAVVQCVLSRFRSGRYPQPTGGCVNLSVPMNFMPAGSR